MNIKQSDTQITKVMILDVDGPLIPRRCLFLEGNAGMMQNADAAVMRFIRAMLDGTGVRIVMCSVWRKLGLEPLDELFRPHGIDIREAFHPDWRTEDFEDTSRDIHRQDEIQRWLEQHPEVTHYCILDDEQHDLPGMVDGISYTDGVMWKHMQRAADLLDLDMNEQCRIDHRRQRQKRN